MRGVAMVALAAGLAACDPYKTGLSETRTLGGREVFHGGIEAKLRMTVVLEVQAEGAVEVGMGAVTNSDNPADYEVEGVLSRGRDVPAGKTEIWTQAFNPGHYVYAVRNRGYAPIQVKIRFRQQ